MSNKTLTFVRSVWDSFRATSGLEPRLLNNLQILTARPGNVTFSLPIEGHHTNRLKILHGGTIACMTDLGGSLAVASNELHATGVTTDLNVTYLSSGGKVGDTILAEAICDKIGKNLAFTEVRFKDEKTGELVARGSHTKFVRRAWEEKEKNNNNNKGVS
ncbi:esterase [Piedraia hortae CBS 480.64]|uniref:Esterase n=1 Tax=Piedraia hortae CBS 480.64 TaxID=1314780 RepID=A0A6A7C9N1_9PEZI|nr:esterase [Piedraia hortae CBS 480.64]